MTLSLLLLSARHHLRTLVPSAYNRTARHNSGWGTTALSREEDAPRPARRSARIRNGPSNDSTGRVSWPCPRTRTRRAGLLAQVRVLRRSQSDRDSVRHYRPAFSAVWLYVDYDHEVSAGLSGQADPIDW